jgi:hypothetical protein
MIEDIVHLKLSFFRRSLNYLSFTTDNRQVLSFTTDNRQLLSFTTDNKQLLSFTSVQKADFVYIISRWKTVNTTLSEQFQSPIATSYREVKCDNTSIHNYSYYSYDT